MFVNCSVSFGLWFGGVWSPARKAAIIVIVPLKTLIKKPRRIDELDLLRGSYIVTIIIDHLQRWPSPLMFVTGEGRLWASAAQGFFIISGLLIGYIRGYKSREQPLKTVATKLWKRAATLYVWSVLITVIVVGLTKWLPVQDMALIPEYPEASNFWSFVWSVINQSYTSDWIYFLRLYWIMLFVSPAVVWLLRRGKAGLVVILSILMYLVTIKMSEPEAAMQWQILFFIPAVLGYYMEPILDWLREHRVVWRILAGTLITASLVTFCISFYWVHGWTYQFTLKYVDFDSYVQTRQWLDWWFTNDPLGPGRVLLGFLWFGGSLAAVHFMRRWLTRWLGWMLFTFGRASLSAYILQAVVLCLVQPFVPLSLSPYYNFALAIVVLLAVWGLLRVPFLRRILPV
ncbi:MAG: rane protein of unknown function [Candidatus Saccharibacteria bacterium]|nr:rane protein of unknown function [Candidatus Saccharibacteria bacterium]